MVIILKSVLVLFLLMITSSAVVHQELVETSRKVSMGTIYVRYHATCFGKDHDIAFIHLHEDELTALEVVRDLLDSLDQHCLVEFNAQSSRLVSFYFKKRKYSVDPNRIFTSTGVGMTLKKLSRSSSAEVVKIVNYAASFYTRNYINKRKLVIAAHNNTNDNYSIISYLPGNPRARDAADVFYNKDQDIDDFIFTTERKYFDRIKEKGISVVLQHNTRAVDDGSMSIYCARKKIPYISVEAEHGHSEIQKRMLEEIIEIIK